MCIFIKKCWWYFLVFCYNPFLSSYSEKKSPLCGTEKNTFPLNNGLKMNLIYKWEDRGWDTDSEILQRVIKEEEIARNHCLLWFEGHCEGKQCSENKFFILGHIPLHHIYLSFWIFLLPLIKYVKKKKQKNMVAFVWLPTPHVHLDAESDIENSDTKVWSRQKFHERWAPSWVLPSTVHGHL